MRRAALTAVLLAATLGGACSSDNNLQYFDAVLSPENEVPARASGASGVARLTYDGTTVTFIVLAANFNNYTQGHIHSGAAGANGPVRVFLYGPAGAARASRRARSSRARSPPPT